MGGRCAELGRIRCAVDVDVAGTGVGISCFQPVQTEDACQHGINGRSGAGPGSHGYAGDEQGVKRSVFPMLGADGKAPERGAAGAFLTAGARRAGGNGGAEKCLPLVIAKGKFLVGDADADGRHWIYDLRFTNYEVRFFYVPLAPKTEAR